jgi:hypothetical protein
VLTSELVKKLREYNAKTGMPISKVIEEAVAEWLIARLRSDSNSWVSGRKSKGSSRIPQTGELSMSGSKIAVNLMDYLPTIPHVGTRPKPKPQPEETLEQFKAKYSL